MRDMQVNAYVDFCIWGPYHHRIMKLMRCIGVFLTPTGDIITKELPGPPSLSEWLKCYDIVGVGYIMIDLLDLGTIDA